MNFLYVEERWSVIKLMINTSTHFVLVMWTRTALFLSWSDNIHQHPIMIEVMVMVCHPHPTATYWIPPLRLSRVFCTRLCRSGKDCRPTARTWRRWWWCLWRPTPADPPPAWIWFISIFFSSLKEYNAHLIDVEERNLHLCQGVVHWFAVRFVYLKNLENMFFRRSYESIPIFR